MNKRTLALNQRENYKCSIYPHTSVISFHTLRQFHLNGRYGPTRYVPSGYFCNISTGFSPNRRIIMTYLLVRTMLQILMHKLNWCLIIGWFSVKNRLTFYRGLSKLDRRVRSELLLQPINNHVRVKWMYGGKWDRTTVSF